MDIALDFLDPLVFDSLYSNILPSEWSIMADRQSWVRQSVSIFLIETIFVTIFYLALSTLSYYLLFDRSLEQHPKFLKNQIRREMWLSITSFPITAIVTIPWFLFELKGYSKLYYNVEDYGWPYLLFSLVWFILFTDFGVYWIHRYEHHPLVYSWLHKPHHIWKITTPYASFAFHPLVTVCAYR
jgi:Delta7-sterol 5-desaturase